MTEKENAQQQPPPSLLSVYLSDGRRISEEISRDMEAQQVIDIIFRQLSIYNTLDNVNVDEQQNIIVDSSNLPVALWVCGKNLRLQLAPQNKLSHTEEKMKTLMQNIPEENGAEVTFRMARNGFFNSEEEERIEDMTLLKLLYLEAKKYIKENVYPLTSLSDDEMIQLNVIESYLETDKNEEGTEGKDKSDCNDNRCPQAARKISKELSYKNSFKKILLTRRVSKLAKRQESRPKSVNEVDLCKDYLRICRKLNCYGGFIFEGQMERSFLESITHREYYDKKVSIIINKKGLHVINKQCPKSKISIKLVNLDYGIVLPKKDKYHPCLYVKDAESYPEKMFQIFTYHAQFIDKTLKTFLEDDRA